jgi:hypothetical protein
MLATLRALLGAPPGGRFINTRAFINRRSLVPLLGLLPPVTRRLAVLQFGSAPFLLVVCEPLRLRQTLYDGVVG